jgi:hypothetical protein
VPDAFESPHPGVLAQVNTQQVNTQQGSIAVGISQSRSIVSILMGDMGVWFGNDISKILDESPDEDL